MVAKTRRGLTAAQEIFAAGIAAGMKQADAYLKAYPAAAKWTRSAVDPKASTLAAKPHVAARIDELLTRAVEANQVTVDRIVRELACIAFSDPRDVLNWGPTGVRLKPSDELTRDQAVTVSEVSERVSMAGVSLTLKRADRLKALELLGKHLRMFGDAVEVTGAGGAPLGVGVTPEQLAKAVRDVTNKF